MEQVIYISPTVHIIVAYYKKYCARRIRNMANIKEYKIDFSKVKDIKLGEVFGTKPMLPSEVIEKIEAYIDENELSNAPPKTPLEKFISWWENTDWEDTNESNYCEHIKVVSKDADVKRVAEIFAKFNNNVDDNDFQLVLENFHKNFIKGIRKAENDK